MASSDCITVCGFDGVELSVELKAAKCSRVIGDMIGDVGFPGEAVPLKNASCTKDVLEKVFEWCAHHKDDKRRDDDSSEKPDDNKNIEVEEWDKKFINVDLEMLIAIILTANFLDIQQLLHLGCKKIADMIKGKTPEEIRKIFNIENDFTPEEEARIREENAWADEI